MSSIADSDSAKPPAGPASRVTDSVKAGKSPASPGASEAMVQRALLSHATAQSRKVRGSAGAGRAWVSAATVGAGVSAGAAVAVVRFADAASGAGEEQAASQPLAAARYAVHRIAISVLVCSPCGCLKGKRHEREMMMQAVGVIGAGQMGAGIAQVSAAAGYRVLLSDVDQARAEAGKAGIAERLARDVEKGKIDADARDRVLERIEPVGDVAGMASCGLVIEAATEREEIKRAIFATVGAVLGHQAVLASNTSSIPITRLAQASPDSCLLYTSPSPRD